MVGKSRHALRGAWLQLPCWGAVPPRGAPRVILASGAPQSGGKLPTESRGSAGKRTGVDVPRQQVSDSCARCLHGGGCLATTRSTPQCARRNVFPRYLDYFPGKRGGTPQVVAYPISLARSFQRPKLRRHEHRE